MYLYETTAHRILEFLYVFGSATRNDMNILSGPASGSVSRAVTYLLDEGLASRKVSSEGERFTITSKGRSIAEEDHDYYRKYKDKFRPSLAREDRAGIREAAALCLGLGETRKKEAPSAQTILVYEREKPSLKDLVDMLSSYDIARIMHGYSAGEKREVLELIPRILERGIFYSSLEIKRYLSTDGSLGIGSAGGESVNSSRICGILVNKEGVFFFYRSAGPVPRFYYEVEKKMTDMLMADRFGRFSGFRQRGTAVPPSAILISRNYHIIPAMITGFAKGRIKSPSSLSSSAVARKRREFFERNFFSAGCSLFSGVYCAAYQHSHLRDFGRIVDTSPADLEKEIELWRKNRPHICFQEGRMTPYCVGDLYEEKYGLDIIYAPSIDLKRFRQIRKLLGSFEGRKVVVVTEPHFANFVSQSLGEHLVLVVDINTGSNVHFDRFDSFGYPTSRPDYPKEASAKRWSSPDRPFKQEKLTVTLSSEAVSCLRDIAKETGCCLSRFTGQLLCELIDGGALGTVPETAPLSAAMYEQDRKTGRKDVDEEKLRAYFDAFEKRMYTTRTGGSLR